MKEKMSDSTFEPQNLIDFVVKKGHGVKGLSQTNLKTIPPQYIQSPEERLDPNRVVKEGSIPIIDVSTWDDPEVANSICKAAEEWVFFQIINHGIPDGVLEDVLQAAHRFFELPVEERRKYLKENSPSYSVQLKTSFSPLYERVMEWKDYLFHLYDGPDNEDYKLWPSVSRDQVLEYIKWARPVIRKLLELLLRGLNVKQIDKAKESDLMGNLVINLLYYPACPQADLAVGAGRHSDISSVTVLLQDDVGGLYVRGSEDGTWIHIPPIKSALVVNIGDILQIMSNGRYKSIEHRVMVSASKNRVSVPIFVNPAPNSVIGPLQEALDGGQKPIYKHVVYSDYFSYFFSKGHDGKQTIEFAKI